MESATYHIQNPPFRCLQVAQLFHPLLAICLITTNTALATIGHALVKGSGDK